MFSYEISKIFKNTYFGEHLQRAASIRSLDWFECLTVESPFCFYSKYIRSLILSWNIFLYGGIFRTRSNI